MGKLSSILGTLTTVQINFFTMRKGTKVGEDAFGNIYYTGKAIKGNKYERRWVVYNGEPEASKVPPEWHGWLHHQTDTVPAKKSAYRKKWQVKHEENPIGQPDQTYYPPGHARSGGKRAKATGDYEAWTPGK